MFKHPYDICFTLVYSDEEIKVETYEGEFRNLMSLINEKIYVEDFGECKGIGRCGTCLVAVEGLQTNDLPMERNEQSTLEKCAAKNENIRLSCQLMIKPYLKNMRIAIVEEREDVR